ncbi:hypothetical protein AAVH_03751 [Aphelenchoides avenae]|nr:hypothetical protein AAVH_03751 [Aphelenchus avenae]
MGFGTTYYPSLGVGVSKSFDYNFDYGDAYTVATDTSASEPSVIKQIVTSVLLGAALVNFLVAIVTTLCSCAKGLAGYRIYAVNLVLTHLIHIANIVLSDRVYNIKKQLAYAVQDYVRKYSVDIKEWAQCVYCLTTFFLIVDAIMRYRRNGIGIHGSIWFLLVLISDTFPLAYIVVKNELYAYMSILPKPLAIYHLVVLLMVSISAALFLLVTIGVGTAQKFGAGKMVRVLLFLIVTLGFQYPCVYMIGIDMSSLVPQEQGMQMMTKFKHMVDITIEINNWAVVARPLAIALGIILLLPTYGDRICRKRCQTSAEEHEASGGSV